MKLRLRWADIYARGFAVTLFLALIFVAACGVVQAQSGRKSKGAPSPPTPPPAAPQVEIQSPSTSGETKPATPRLSLIVVRSAPNANVSLWAGLVYRDLVGRLRESTGLEVREGKEMNRKEAINLARSQEDENTYVAWLQLEVDVESGDTDNASISTVNPGCLNINYILYSPQTGKVKAQGKVYQDGYQSVCVGTARRPSPIPTSRSGRLPAQYTLKKAAREAADRMLDALSLARLPRR